MDRTMSSRVSDRGQATVLLLACVVFIALLAVGVGTMGDRLSAHARARTAADAAAVAGITTGAVGAGRVAGRNGAALVSFASAGGPDAITVTVVVEVDGQYASARATNGP
jgi:hypothetical protein